MGSTRIRPVTSTASAMETSSPAPSLWRKLKDKWDGMQVGRQGKYSVERLESLDHYCKTTSWTRAILVCVLTPVPVTFFTIGLECLPLRRPSEGWVANWVFWIRLAVVIGLVNFSFLSELVIFLPGLPFTLRRRALASGIFATSSLGFYFLLAELIGFPIPFAWNWGMIPTAVLFPPLLMLVLGRAPFEKKSPFQPYLKRLSRLCVAHMTLIAIFPVCKVLYDSTAGMYQRIVIIMLPVWKFAGKQFIARASRDLEDFMPEAVTFIADFFSTFFLSVCMYSSGSMEVSALVIAIDAVQTVLELHEVRANADEVLKLLHVLNQRSCEDGQQILAKSFGLVELILGITRYPCAYKVDFSERVRLWACLPHVITSKQIVLLQKLGESGKCGDYCFVDGQSPNRFQRYNSTATHGPRLARSLTNNAMVGGFSSTPKTSLLPPHVAGAELVVGHVSSRAAENFVVEGLQLLFHCEYLTLVEYIECVVPLIFVSYKSTLQLLPNAVFYPDDAGRWGLAVVANILLLSLMEFGSFILLNMFLRRKFAFSPLYQLAFVLETQMALVQAKLFLAVLCLLPYQLEHLGVDFTLQFIWLRKNSQKI